MNRRPSFESKILKSFAVASIVVVGVAALLIKISLDAISTTDWVQHTYQVLNDLAQIKANTVRIELSTQNFRITGDNAYLFRRNETIADRERLMQRVKETTQDNKSQQELFWQLREVINQRLQISKHSEMLRQTQGVSAATEFVANSPLQETRVRVYKLLGDMEENELHLLDDRLIEQKKSRQVMVVCGLIASLLLLLLLTSTFALIRRQFREIRSANSLLQEREENLSITLHSIGDGVIATDAAGCVIRMNPVAERLTGWSFAEARGLNIGDIFNITNEKTREPVINPITRVLETKEVQSLANHTIIISKNGVESPISDSAAPILDTSGQMRGAVLVFRDVINERRTEQFLAEQKSLLELQVAEQMRRLREGEEQFRQIINTVPALIAYVDAEEHYVYANELYKEQFVPQGVEIRGHTVREILGDRRYAYASPFIKKALEGTPQTYDWEPFPGVWQIIRYMPHRDEQQVVTGYYVQGIDITERKITEQQIQQLNIQLEQHVHDLEQASRALKVLSAGNRAMLRASDEGELLDSMCNAIVESGNYPMALIYYCDEGEPATLKLVSQCYSKRGPYSRYPATDERSPYLEASNLIREAIMLGEALVSHNVHQEPLSNNMDAGYNRSSIACPLRHHGAVIGALVIYDNRFDSFTPDETVVLSEAADDLAFGIGILRARVAQKQIEENLYQINHFDALTGLANSNLFTETLALAIESAKRESQTFAILQTNIERLSEINDTLGFDQGDLVLREFGNRLSIAISEHGTVARLRGDEFAILLPGGDIKTALNAVRDVTEALAMPFQLAGVPLDLSTKFGIATFPEHGTTLHELFRHVDIATHQAKRKGLQQVVFDPISNPHQAQRLAMAAELKQAIENGDLVLYLQPKVKQSTREVCGAEGLVRWQHREKGLIPPCDFIELAEHTGLIKPLTEWVINAAQALLHDWAGTDVIVPIAVNLSPRNFRDDNLVEKIQSSLRHWRTPEGLLEIEITESTVMDDADFAIGVLHQLRQLGILLSIDDFGTGYSSLAYLQRLPVDYIKIDQSFVRQMASSRDSAAIVRSTIDLVHDLGRKAIAEGVETQENWDSLALLGCDILQGYLLAKPMPANEFPDWVRQFRIANEKLI